jgi:hypothetical protein
MLSSKMQKPMYHRLCTHVWGAHLPWKNVSHDLLMKGCNWMCASVNHFHNLDIPTPNHFCSSVHQCSEECEAEGNVRCRLNLWRRQPACSMDKGWSLSLRVSLSRLLWERCATFQFLNSKSIMKGHTHTAKLRMCSTIGNFQWAT